MRFSSLVLGTDQKIIRPASIGRQVAEFLSTCDDEVFRVWKDSFPNPKGVSLSDTLQKAVFPTVDELLKGRDTSGSGWLMMQGFKHRSYTGQLFIDIVKESRRNNARCLVVTQSNGFKRKFRYNSSTMTIDSLLEDFCDYCQILGVSTIPEIAFVVFDDFEFDTSTYYLYGKSILKLEKKHDS